MSVVDQRTREQIIFDNLKKGWTGLNERALLVRIVTLKAQTSALAPSDIRHKELRIIEREHGILASQWGKAWSR